MAAGGGHQPAVAARTGREALARRAPFLGYRLAAAVAPALPGPLADEAARALGLVFAQAMRGRRRVLERHLRRVHGEGLSGPALERAVAASFDSYARYWMEAFRMSRVGPAALEENMSYEGLGSLRSALARGRGAILALPHLGGWDFGGAWLASTGVPVTVVVEPLEPPELFEWFSSFRRGLGMEVVPLGPRAPRALLAALAANRAVGLLCDRDIGGGGVEVEFFGERTTLPGGPALLALRSGAPLLPTAIYFEGRSGHRGLVRPPVPAERRAGSLAEDVARITQALAAELEALVRRAPEQWHLFQPNWPSARGRRAGSARPGAGPPVWLALPAVRIAQVCPYSLTVPGGVQAQALGLARALRAQGHEARVLAPCDGPPPAAFVTPLGNSVPTASNGSIAPLAPDPSCALRTIRALRDEDFDVVHLHEPFAPGPTLTSLFFTDRPSVGTFHRSGASRAYAFAPRLARRMAQRLAARFAVSEDARATAEAALGGAYEVLHNGVEVERWASAPPWPTEGPTVFFVGRHEPRKGLAVLLEAAAHLPRSVRLWVAGSGPQTAELHRAHAGDPRVEWLGRLPEAEVASRLRGAHVACFPSLHGESFGVVLLEAMAASTPVVASDLAGYRNVARAGRDALLVPPGDAPALAEALRRVLCDDVLAKELVAAGEGRAAGFSMDRLAARYAKRYASLAARSA